MAEDYRRIILKPSGLDDEQLARLRTSLAAAIEVQRDLAARSPHILQFTGDLQEDEHAFLIHHEPARPLDLHDLFNPQAAGWEARDLIRMAAALLDALRVAHEKRDPRPLAHGGVCPGVLLLTPDGVEKVSDFGIAPAICAALDTTSYVNLAVGPGGGDHRPPATGVWEILTPDVHDRDDRICAFIDPEKYGTQMYQSFEPGSDLIAAGFILHLLAEHRHPYFHDTPEAHRVVDLVEFGMPMNMATQARRKDLRESGERAVQVWCELVSGMIDRLPENRPSAAASLAQLAETGVRPVDAGEILRRRVEALCRELGEQSVHEVAWEELRRTVAPIANNPEAPPEAVRPAAALLKLADGMVLLDGPDWPRAADLVGDLLKTSDLPAELTRKAGEAGALIEHNGNVRRLLEEVRSTLDALATSDPQEVLDRLPDLQAKLDRLPAGDTLPKVARETEQLQASIRRRGEEAAAQRLEIETTARDWLARLDAAFDERNWDGVEEALAARPQIPAWLDEITGRIADIEAERRVRRELAARLEEAESLLAGGDVVEAQERVTPVQRRQDHPDLAERAQELQTRISAAVAELKAAEQALLEARARIDAMLEEAREHASAEDPTLLEQAERHCRQIIETSEASDRQRDDARQLLERMAREHDARLAEAQEGIEALQRYERALGEARQHLESGRCTTAADMTGELTECAFPQIREPALELLAEAQAAIQTRRRELEAKLAEADGCLTGNRPHDALTLAEQVARDECADEPLREEAQRHISAARKAVEEAEQARRQAAEDASQATNALQRAELREVRSRARAVLDNPHAEPDVHARISAMIAFLPALEEAQSLIDQEDFPEALDRVSALRRGGQQLHPAAETAARLLAERAYGGFADTLRNGIREHLEQRARGIEQPVATGVAEAADVPAGRTPEWMRARLGHFDTFLQDVAQASPSRSPEAEAPAAHRMLAVGDRLGDKYEILDFLGRGGMGEVYRARDLKLDREVALKLAPPAAQSAKLADALRNEAKAIAALRHPRIIHINSFDVIDDRPCFDTNYLHGSDLAEYARRHPLSHRQIAETIIEVAEALAYAHEQGVQHGDIKPQNIYLGESATGTPEGPWLIDFGLARMRSIYDRRVTTGLSGTPGYIAPEVIASMGEQVDHRADIYALGCVLYGLLANRPPFQKVASEDGGSSTTAGSIPSVSRVLLGTLRGEFDPLAQVAPETPEPLRAICERAMAAEPAERYQNALELAADLRQFLLESDEARARDDLAAAGQAFSGRRQREPAELDDLDTARTRAEAARATAQSVADRAKPEDRARAENLAADAATLLERIERERERILAAQREAPEQLQAANAAMARRQWRPARVAANAVCDNPYVPDLHPQAKALLEQAEGLRRARRRTGLTRAAVACVVLIGLVGAAWLVGRPRSAIIHHEEDGWQATAAAMLPLRYQWWEAAPGTDSWSPVSGQTHPVFPFTAAAPGTRYRCRVSNMLGSDTTQIIEPRPPHITQHPEDRQVAADQRAEFSVRAEGDPPPAYAWQKLDPAGAWTTVHGRTTNALTLHPVTEADAGRYRCVVTNALGSQTSEPAVLELVATTPEPVIEPREPDPTPVRPEPDPTPDPPVPTPALITLALAPGDDTGHSDADNVTHKEEVTLHITIDAGTEIVVEVNGVEAGRVTAEDAGRHALENVPLTEGVHRITATAVVEQADPIVSEPLVVTVDTTPPALEQISAPSRAATNRMEPVTYTLTFNEPVAGLTRDGITLLNPSGAASAEIAVSPDGPAPTADWTVTLSNCTGDGELGIRIEEGAAFDVAGNRKATGAESPTFIVDNTPPALADISGPSTTHVNAAANAIWELTFSEPVSGLTADGLVLSRDPDPGADAVVSISPEGPEPAAQWTVRLADFTGDGMLRISVAAGAVSDAAGNRNAVGDESDPVHVDTTPPTITALSSPSSAETDGGTPVSFTVTFSEPVTGLSPAGIVLHRQPDPGPEATVSVTPDPTEPATAWTVSLSDIRGDGTLGLSIRAGAAFDQAGNANEASAPSATFAIRAAGWPDWIARNDEVVRRLAELVDAVDGDNLQLTSDDGRIQLLLRETRNQEQPVAHVRIDPPQGWTAGTGESAEARHSAAQHLMAVLEREAGAADLARLRYLSWWKRRSELEARLPAQDTVLSEDAAAEFLTELAAIKWMQPPGQSDGPAGRIQATQALRSGLDERTGRWARPNRFIEYFWGDRQVHAFVWGMDSAPGRPAIRVSSVAYLRLGDASRLAGLLGTGGAEPRIDEPELGESLLGRILAMTLSFPDGAHPFLSSDGGWFGLAAAPDGPLCFVPIHRIAFQPVAVELTLGNRLAPLAPAESVTLSGMTRLEELCQGQFRLRPSGLWTLASIVPPAGQARVEDRWRLVAVAHGQADALSFQHVPQRAAVLVTTSPQGALQDLADIHTDLAGLVQQANPAARVPMDGGFLHPRGRPSEFVLVSDHPGAGGR